MRDLSSQLSTVVSVAPQVSTTTVVGASVDLRGFDSAVVNVALGIGGITFTGTNRIDVLLEHSNDGSTWTPVTGAMVQVTPGAIPVVNGVVRSFQAAHPAPSNTEIGYVGDFRFVRPTLTFAGTHATGTPVQASVTRGHASLRPVA